MKHFFILFILLFIITPSIRAQDTIALNNGQKIAAKHVHIQTTKIYYTHIGKYRRDDSVNKSEVNYVVRKSGWKIPMIQPTWYNPVTINPGIGLSTILYKFKDPISDTGANIISFSPVYSLNIEYAPTQKFSFGIGVAWQSLKLNPYVSNTYHTPIPLVPPPNGHYTTQSYTFGGPDESVVETLTRLNVGARLLYHIRNDDVKDFYIGARASLSFWTDKSTPQWDNVIGSSPVPGIQALIGMRREITSFLSGYIEGGIGSPYFADMGVSFKVNTHKK